MSTMAVVVVASGGGERNVGFFVVLSFPTEYSSIKPGTQDRRNHGTEKQIW
jgi:hypothetical protein